MRYLNLLRRRKPWQGPPMDLIDCGDVPVNTIPLVWRSLEEARFSRRFVANCGILVAHVVSVLARRFPAFALGYRIGRDQTRERREFTWKFEEVKTYDHGRGEDPVGRPSSDQG